MFSFHFKEYFAEDMNSIKTQIRKLPESINSHNIPAATPIIMPLRLHFEFSNGLRPYTGHESSLCFPRSQKLVFRRGKQEFRYGLHVVKVWYTQSIKYQSKHNSLLNKIQIRATCFDFLLSRLQALKEQIQGNHSFIVHFVIPNAYIG
jgi:hypothetical protein